VELTDIPFGTTDWLRIESVEPAGATLFIVD